MKVKIFRERDIKELEKDVNKFIKEKSVVDIKLTTDVFYDRYINGVPVSVIENKTVMIMYTDKEQQFSDSRKKHAIL